MVCVPVWSIIPSLKFGDCLCTGTQTMLYRSLIFSVRMHTLSGKANQSLSCIAEDYRDELKQNSAVLK